MYKTFSYVFFYSKGQAVFSVVMMYIAMVILAVELIRCILKLIYEKKKYETSKREIPILPPDKNSLGESTVYKTISSPLTKLAKKEYIFDEKFDQKSKKILFNVEQHGIPTSLFEKANAVHNVPGMKISQKPKLGIIKNRYKKLIKDKSINKSKKIGAKIKENLKLKISIQSEPTQAENIVEEKHKI